MGNQMFFAALAGGNADAAAEWEENALEWKRHAKALEVEMLELKNLLVDVGAGSIVKTELLEKHTGKNHREIAGGKDKFDMLVESKKEEARKILLG
ncbi:hypothetical protein CKO35_14470 [Ectothiorhodospira shaposhnikovii]|uniref:hypothetical protein n=1 Tax=Ectothiorhodospira shaposhnikovii TaxID=1054 RepID=UPI0019064B30|nr:hypothetical protein [Ectothiorhodospira shaposhnikovii]MBK1674478.1 hypothetical protein [Ectothiorhodospira shaposhnikovii]